MALEEYDQFLSQSNFQYMAVIQQSKGYHAINNSVSFGSVREGNFYENKERESKKCVQFTQTHTHADLSKILNMGKGEIFPSKKSNKHTREI